MDKARSDACLTTIPPRNQLATWFHDHVDWPDAVLPDYAGGSVANVPVSVLRAFGASTVHEHLLPPLRADLIPSDFMDAARVIVVVVIDGLSAAALARDGAGFVDVQPHVSRTITSVFPSTTAAALTSLQFGTSPGSHGMAGYTVLLPAVGRVVNLVRMKPADGSALDPSRLDPRSVVPLPSMFDLLRDAGIESVVVSHHEYARSPLTLAHSGETEYLGYRTPAEMAWRLHEAVERPGRRFVFGYWAGIDMLAHSWGPASGAVQLDLRLLERALIDGFLKPLGESGGDVVVVLTADHGHTSVTPVRACSLADLAKVTGGWSAPPTGERRAVGLTPAPGGDVALRDAVRGRGVVVSVADALLHGLFGPRPHHPELLSRVGELLLVAQSDASFPYRHHDDEKGYAPGAHGSLTLDEMLVPLLGWRFGG